MKRGWVELAGLILTALGFLSVGMAGAEAGSAAPLERSLEIESGRSSIQMEGLTLEIITVPPLPGAAFRLYPPCSLYVPGGESITSLCFSGELLSPDVLSMIAADDGVARAEVESAGLYILEALPWQGEADDLRPEFSRWGDDLFLPSREIMITGDIQLQAGYDVHRRAELKFVDQDSRPVDETRIESVMVRSSHGNVHYLDPGELAMLQSGRVLRRDSGDLEEIDIIYAVQSVIMDGSEVVNRGQQRFLLDEKQPWQIDLLLFSAQIQARDALFGFGVGQAIDVEYPDGDVERLPLDENAVVELPSLARGTYQVRVVGGWGYSPPTILALSRDQTAQAIVVTVFDIALVAILGIFIALTLLWIGRPGLLRSFRRGESKGSHMTSKGGRP